MERLIPSAKHGGRPRRVDGREVLNAKLAEVREQFRGAKVNSNENPTNAEISLNFIRNLALLMLGRHAEAPGLMDDLARHEASVGDAPIIASKPDPVIAAAWLDPRARRRGGGCRKAVARGHRRLPRGGTSLQAAAVGCDLLAGRSDRITLNRVGYHGALNIPARSGRLSTHGSQQCLAVRLEPAALHLAPEPGSPAALADPSPCWFDPQCCSATCCDRDRPRLQSCSVEGMHMLKVAIGGAGWYGCHIGATLLALGLEVRIFEKDKRPLGGASGNNQFRLHMGFHYPRSHRTRLQSRDGYARFMERYPGLSAEVPKNIYAVPKGDSLIDFQTYKLIMSAAGIEYRETSPANVAALGYCNLDGVLECEERVILTNKARSYFERRLDRALMTETPITHLVEADDGVMVNGERYDFFIDTTWGHLLTPTIPCFWEPTILLYYEGSPNEAAFTLVDGPLASIYPTETPGLYTLSSVPHTPLGNYDSAAAAVVMRDSVGAELIAHKRRQMEEQIARNVVGFQDRFRFADVQLSVKTKPTGASDDRSCWVGQYGRSFSVLSGKIDTIFFASQVIIAKLEAEVDARGLEMDHDQLRRG